MSERSGIPSGPDPRFEKQKEKLVQLLKNRNDFLARTTRDEDPAAPRPHDPERSAEDSRHAMPINAEVMRRWSDRPAAKAFREVERELETIRSLTPFVYRPLYDLFLHEGAGDADYDRLRKESEPLQALRKEIASTEALRRKIESGKSACKHPEERIAELDEQREDLVKKALAAEKANKRLASVEMALYMLTMRLIDRDLYAVFPSRYLPGGRGQTMEENYRAIHRIFLQECDHHARTMKRYRKKAYETAAALCGCSVSTVERAVHFVESVEEGAA